MRAREPTARPSRGARLVEGLAVAACAALYGAASGLPLAAAAVAVLGLAGAAPRRPLPWPAAAQAVLAAASGAAAWLVAATTTPAATRGVIQLLAPLPSGVALAALLIAATRVALAHPAFGRAGSAALVIVAATASGFGDIGALFPVLAGAATLLALAALETSDPDRPGPLAWGRRRAAAAVAALLVALGAGAGAALALPPLYDAALGLAGLSPGGARSGFSTSLRLGSLAGMLESDEPVLRISGPHADHLRGVVFTRYEGGRWRAPAGGRPRRVRLGEAPPGPRTTIRRAGRDDRRFFVPLDATAFDADGGVVLVDEMGVLFPDRGLPADSLSFVAGRREAFAPAPPNEEDVAVPDEIAGALAAIARRWTAGATTDAARLEALSAQLAEGYEYALVFHRPVGEDPVLHFLEQSKRGHCEYFASALALLARSLGIPARVVGGYRVLERNGLGGYDVVRERHAHAWVEAWVEGRGWVTVDPTPAAALDAAGGEMAGLAAVADLIAAVASRAKSWLFALRATHVLGAAAAALLAWLALRLLRRRRRGPTRVGRTKERFRAPPEALGPFLEALAGAGVERGRVETLEAYAERVAGEGALGERGRAAAEILRRYAACRYGGQGDSAALATEMDRWRRPTSSGR